MTEPLVPPVTPSRAAYVFEGRFVGSKRSWFAKAFPDGAMIRIPESVLLVGGVAAVVATLTALGHLGKVTKPKVPGRYGPSNVTSEDYDYAWAEVPVLSPFGALTVPLGARAHRNYRMQLAAEIAEPSPAGIPDAVLGYADLANYDWVAFTLSSGETYHMILIPARTVDEFPGGHSQEYWQLADGSMNSVEDIEGTIGGRLKAQARLEKLWPPRKLTADEKKYGHRGPPAREESKETGGAATKSRSSPR